MKRFPTAAETASVMVGVVNFVKNPVAAFVRLSKARDMGIQVGQIFNHIGSENYNPQTTLPLLKMLEIKTFKSFQTGSVILETGN